MQGIIFPASERADRVASAEGETTLGRSTLGSKVRAPPPLPSAERDGESAVSSGAHTHAASMPVTILDADIPAPLVSGLEVFRDHGEAERGADTSLAHSCVRFINLTPPQSL